MEAGRKLHLLQDEISRDGYYDILQNREATAQTDLDLALNNMEEEFWKVKARIQSNVVGDRNTKFFHTYARSRIRRKTNIMSSININDLIVTNNNIM